MSTPQDRVRAAAAAWTPHDDLGRRQRGQVLDWLASTEDIYRRVKPDTPPMHLVAYFLLVDRAAGQVLLCDHRLAGLWLPTGGHVEPGEDPADTVRREVGEELGVPAAFVDGADLPFFWTVTLTSGHSGPQHTDVSAWFALLGEVGMPLEPDAGEFHGVRWYSRGGVERLRPERRDPHLLRALDALGLA